VGVVPYLPRPFPGKGIPPFGPGFAPAHNIAGRIRDKLLGPLVFGPAERAVRPVVNEIRTRIGLPCISDGRDLFSRAPLTLYLTAEPFEFHRSGWPDSFRLVGPISFDPPGPAPEWLDKIDRPIVLVTTSSEFQDDGRLIRTALEGLRDENVYVVATLPSGDRASFDVPPNARVGRWLSHSAVLPRATCVVTHGSMGATQKALAAGVPVVVVPFGRDQLEVARRAEVSGAGVRVPVIRLFRSGSCGQCARLRRNGQRRRSWHGSLPRPVGPQRLRTRSRHWSAPGCPDRPSLSARLAVNGTCEVAPTGGNSLRLHDRAQGRALRPGAGRGEPQIATTPAC